MRNFTAVLFNCLTSLPLFAFLVVLESAGILLVHLEVARTSSSPSIFRIRTAIIKKLAF